MKDAGVGKFQIILESYYWNFNVAFDRDSVRNTDFMS